MASCIGERKATPRECLNSKGFPSSTPIPSQEAGYRFAGNAVPVTYFTELSVKLATALDDADCPMVIDQKPDEYVTYGDTPSELHDKLSLKGSLGTKKGHNIIHNVSRENATRIPVCKKELELMRCRHRSTRFARLADNSLRSLRINWRHWVSFCTRFSKPKFILAETVEQKAAAASQVELFMNYECGVHFIKAASVEQKLNAVSNMHAHKHMADPFANNSVIRKIIANQKAMDAPSEPKVPVTNATLKFIRKNLQLSRRPDFTLWTCIRFAIAYLCRVSEYAVNDLYTVRWEHLVFYTHRESEGGRRKIDVTSVDQLDQIAELQVIFHSDKTARPGEGRARSFHAIPDVKNTKCIVRDMARLWLVSERVEANDVFSWDSNTKGVTRHMINTTLKTAAVATGIPAADVSSHSLRCSGLTRLLSNDHGKPMPFEMAKKFGRWKSDCALRYFWASAEVAEGYAESLWDSSCFIRTRGDGVVQFLH